MIAWLPQFLRNGSFSNSLTFLIVPAVFYLFYIKCKSSHIELDRPCQVNVAYYKESQDLGPT